MPMSWGWVVVTSESVTENSPTFNSSVMMSLHDGVLISLRFLSSVKHEFNGEYHRDDPTNDSVCVRAQRRTIPDGCRVDPPPRW